VSLRSIAALALAGAALVAVPADAGTPTTRTVAVEDNFFAPANLTVRAGTTIRWRWPEGGGDVHDVKLTSAPRGVRRFQSDPASSSFTFRRRLTKVGRYRFVCTFHIEDGMVMTVRVRR
jgi:plastocyanin